MRRIRNVLEWPFFTLCGLVGLWWFGSRLASWDAPPQKQPRRAPANTSKPVRKPALETDEM